MTEREKWERVVKGLENIVSDMQEEIDEWRDYSDSELSHGVTCDCEWWYNTAQMLKDALALLKTQEPVEPTWRLGVPFCSKCGRQFKRGYKYCPDCGRAVKWE